MIGLGPLPDRGEAEKGCISASPDAAKGVISVTRDGMGPVQQDAIQLSTVGPYERPAMDRLPVEGTVGTISVRSDGPPTFITDSAVATTARAPDIKTFNRTVGVDTACNVVPPTPIQSNPAHYVCDL